MVCYESWILWLQSIYKKEQWLCSKWWRTCRKQKLLVTEGEVEWTEGNPQYVASQCSHSYLISDAKDSTFDPCQQLEELCEQHESKKQHNHRHIINYNDSPLIKVSKSNTEAQINKRDFPSQFRCKEYWTITRLSRMIYFNQI